MHARGLAVGVVTLMAMLSGGVILANPSTADEMPLAKSVGTQLPLQDFRAMELDEDRGRLYFAQGAGSSLPLVVTDLDGVLQRDVTDVTGVSDVVLSNDQQTLYVAQDFDRVTALDADTLVPSATYDAPNGACVYAVEPAGDNPTPTIVSKRDNTGSNLQDYALSPDGTEVVESVGNPYEHHSYRLPDLSDATTYPSGAYPLDAAWSGDGSTVAVARSSTGSNDADVLFYDKDSTTSKYAVDFRASDELWKGALVVNSTGTRAWAVTYDDTYQSTQLLHSFGPAYPPKAPITDIAITARTGSGKAKGTAYVTVTWTSPLSRPGSSTNQQFVNVSASTNGGSDVLIGGAEMTTARTYTTTYPLPRGTTTFTARYKDFENWYPPATVTATLSR